MKSKSPQTYRQANKRPSQRIWPGCGDGRKRWCGSIHDYSYTLSTGDLVHKFECTRNHRQGCPQPIPEPGISFEEWKELKCKKEEKDQ